MIPSTAVLASLMRSRLVVRRARATAGVGERQSCNKGSSLEFMGYGQYQPGDDVRHLDPHLHARTGRYYVRQYAAYRQLNVTIIIDGSTSMDYGTPTKYGFACGLGSALAFVALAGDDVVRLGLHQHDRIAWSPRVRGVARFGTLLDWMTPLQPSGSRFGRAFGEALPDFPGRGLVIVLSDWWDDDLDAGLAALGSSQHEVFAVHILSPQELDPSLLGAGEVRLIDSESRLDVELSMNREVFDGYGRALAAWQDRLQREITKCLGRYLPVRSDASLDRVLLHDWRRRGLIG
jgi:uncharacterized protein (DUF58 family)